MPKPDLNTAVAALVSVVRSLSGWCETYVEQLCFSLGEGFDGVTRATELADAYERHDAAFWREQREDIANTRHKNATIADAQTTLRAVDSGAELGFRLADADYRSVRRDFIAQAPSSARGVGSVRRTLQRARQGVTSHAEVLDRAVPGRVARLLAQIDASIEALDAVDVGHAREKQETAQARRRREQSREQALRFVDVMELAAREHALDTPEMLAQLHILFDAHNPAQRRAASTAPASSDEAASPSGAEVTAQTPSPDIPDDDT